MDLISQFFSLWSTILTSTLLMIQVVLSNAASYVDSHIEASAPVATTTISIDVPTTIVATTTASTTPRASVATTTKSAASKPKIVTATTTPTQKPQESLTPLLSAEAVNTNTRQSIVNILCSVSSEGYLRSISGSGVIIDARGIIVTNAHIGQYFLLRDYPTKGAVDCVVRTGSPAAPKYRATLLYLPPAWINANASQLIAEHGLGTGQDDYALIQITSTTDPNGSLPSSFQNMTMSAGLDTGDSVLVAGYPAGFLDSIIIEKSLYATSAFTTIGQLYTFDSPTHIDVVSLGGTVVSQGGSSGGAVVRLYDGKLAGLIATATAGTTTASRDLRAITVSHIDRSLRAYGKGGLVEFLSQDPAKQAADFASTTFEGEKQTLIQVLNPAR